MTDDISMHTAWADALRADCERATMSITISAISMQPPRSAGSTPWKLLWRAWEKAAARGVLVQIYLPTPSRSHPATHGNTDAAIQAVKAGMFVSFVPQPRLLHAKSITIDNETCWIGSGNMTAAAAHHNHEIYIRFDNMPIARKIKEWLKTIANI